MIKKFSNLKVFSWLFLGGILLFGWLMKFGYFFSDDFTWLWHAQKMHSLQDILTFKMASYYSPVMNAFYYIHYHLFYYQTAYYYLSTIIVHVLISFIIFLIIGKISSQKKLAILGAIFFLIAGSAHEPVMWLAANIHVFATLFVVLAVYFYILFLDNHKLQYAGLTLIAFVLALCSKEIAFVSFPLIVLTGLYFGLKNKKLDKTFAHKVLLVLLAVGTIIYALFEYQWQRHSTALSSGYWQLDLSQFLRWPVIIVDTLLPFSKLVDFQSRYFFYLASVLLLAILFYYLRKSKLFYFGLLWIMLASLPTIFAVDKLWMPFASRYTYLPKIGAVLLLVALLHKLFATWKPKYVYSLVGLVFACNVAYFVYVALSEYPAVYQTGLSLTEVVEEIGQLQATQVFMVYPFPFKENHAHVVGVFSTLINLPEDKIILIDPKELESVESEANSVRVYWDAKKESYFIK